MRRLRPRCHRVSGQRDAHPRARFGEQRVCRPQIRELFGDPRPVGLHADHQGVWRAHGPHVHARPVRCRHRRLVESRREQCASCRQYRHFGRHDHGYRRKHRRGHRRGEVRPVRRHHHHRRRGRDGHIGRWSRRHRRRGRAVERASILLRQHHDFRHGHRHGHGREMVLRRHRRRR